MLLVVEVLLVLKVLLVFEVLWLVPSHRDTRRGAVDLSTAVSTIIVLLRCISIMGVFAAFLVSMVFVLQVGCAFTAVIYLLKGAEVV